MLSAIPADVLAAIHIAMWLFIGHESARVLDGIRSALPFPLDRASVAKFARHIVAFSFHLALLGIIAGTLILVAPAALPIGLQCRAIGLQCRASAALGWTRVVGDVDRRLGETLQDTAPSSDGRACAHVDTGRARAIVSKEAPVARSQRSAPRSRKRDGRSGN